MRKEVKLGFAIGGVLLAVLVVYVLVVSAPESNHESVTLTTSGDSSNAGHAPAPVVEPKVETPTPAPALTRVDPAPLGNDPFTAGTDPGMLPATLPSEANTPHDDTWSAALQTGKIPVLMTETPVVTPAEKPDLSALSNTPTVDSGTGVSDLSNTPALVTGSQRTGTMRLSPATLPTGQSAGTHVVKSGENFSTIAAEVYGNASYFSHLMRANPTLNPNNLRPGMVINVPAASEVRAEHASAAQKTAGADTKVDPRTEYRVESGDSLYKISMKLYGKGDHIDKLYDTNKSTIGPNREALKVGMILKLADPPVASR